MSVGRVRGQRLTRSERLEVRRRIGKGESFEDAAEAALRLKPNDRRIDAGEIKELVGQLKGIVNILHNADPEDRKAVYQEPNLSIVYHDDGRIEVSARTRSVY